MIRFADMEVGAVYITRFHDVLRYHGVHKDCSACLAFQGLLEPVSNPPRGYKVKLADIVRKVTKDDLPELKQAAAEAMKVASQAQKFTTLMKLIEELETK